MGSRERSLHSMVAHWLVPDPAKPVRVTKFRNRRSTRECYVYIETVKAGGQVAMFFFRHQDGTWRIYPPTRKRLALSIHHTSARF